MRGALCGADKLRKLVFLTGASPTLGLPSTVLLGTVAFTAATALMALEAAVLRCVASGAPTPPPASATAAAARPTDPPNEAEALVFAARLVPDPAAAAAAEPAVQPPSVRDNLARNLALMCVLLGGQRGGEAGFAAAKVLVLIFLSAAWGSNPGKLARARARGLPCSSALSTHARALPPGAGATTTTRDCSASVSGRGSVRVMRTVAPAAERN